MSSALDKSTKKTVRKKQIVTATITFMVLCALFVYIYARSMNNASEALQSKPPTASKSTQPASQVDKDKGDTQLLSSDAPAKRVADAQEQEAKEEALKTGTSHVNSTVSIKEKTERYEQRQTPPPLPKPPTRKQVQQAKQAQTTKMTQQQLLTKRVQDLLMPNPAFPPPPNYSQVVATKMAEIDAIAFDSPNFTNSAVDQITTFTSQPANTLPDGSPSQIYDGVNGRPTRQAPSNGASNTQPNGKPQEKMVKVVGSGDMLLTELKYQVVSDFNVPVFFDVVEPPLQKMRFIGNFQMTQNQEGVLLRVNRYEMGDHSGTVDGYGLEIGADLSPLFDSNVDTHFSRRFLARASSAFVLPFLDFVKATTTTITNGNVVISQDPVTSTKDRVIGGIANVASEFLPDLRKNANIPPTVTIPANTPVGIVFATPLSLPEKLLEEHGSSQSNTYYDYGVNY